ncbi:MAG TPA: LysR family transcriptional regulator [Polyangiaceae bacterium]
MDLNLLPIFVAVAETKSFTEAARKLELPRSTVSRAVATLEDSLRVQLLRRTTRQVALTSAGERFFSNIATQLSAVRDAVDCVTELDPSPAGELRITAPHDLGSLLLAPVSVGFTQRFPSVRLDVRLTNRTVDLVAEGFDAALRVSTKRLADSSLVAQRVSSIEMQVFASPEYLEQHGSPKSPAEAAKHEWIEFRGFAVPEAMVRPKSTPHIEVDDILFIHQALRCGAGLGVLPTFIAANDVAEGRLVRVLPRITLPLGSVYLIHPSAQHVPRKVTAFRDYLIEYLDVHPMSGTQVQ